MVLLLAGTVKTLTVKLFNLGSEEKTMHYRTDISLITKTNLIKIADLVNQRNDLMKEVAECKVRLDLPIEDCGQEESVIAYAKLAAETLGLEPDSIIPFFEALIQISKNIQTNYAGCLRCEIQHHSSARAAEVNSIQLRALRAIIAHINSRILVCVVQQLVLHPINAAFRMTFTERLSVQGIDNDDKQMLFNGLMQAKLARQ